MWCCVIIFLSFVDFSPRGDGYLFAGVAVLLKIMSSALCEQVNEMKLGYNTVGNSTEQTNVLLYSQLQDKYKW